MQLDPSLPQAAQRRPTGPRLQLLRCSKRPTITVADVISNHRIDRLESVRGADGTVLG